MPSNISTISDPPSQFHQVSQRKASVQSCSQASPVFTFRFCSIIHRSKRPAYYCECKRKIKTREAWDRGQYLSTIASMQGLHFLQSLVIYSMHTVFSYHINNWRYSKHFSLYVLFGSSINHHVKPTMQKSCYSVVRYSYSWQKQIYAKLWTDDWKCPHSMCNCQPSSAALLYIMSECLSIFTVFHNWSHDQHVQAQNQHPDGQGFQMIQAQYQDCKSRFIGVAKSNIDVAAKQENSILGVIPLNS